MFCSGLCKVGLPKGGLTKCVKKLRDLSTSFVVLYACNIDSSADYIYELKGFKKKYEFVDGRFKFNKSNHIFDCNKCSFKKTEIMKELDNCRRMLSSLTAKTSNLAIMEDIDVKSEFSANDNKYL